MTINKVTMMIPFHEASYEEIKLKKYKNSLRKAKHLADRVKMFLSDINKSDMHDKHKKFILDMFKNP